MKFLHDLGAFAWVYAAMLLVVAALAVRLAMLRSKSPGQRADRSIGIALLLLALAFPVVGFAGTIIGLQHAFDSTSNVDPSQKSTRLAEGISIAMNATAAGLGLLVPALGVAVAALATGAKRPPKKQSPPASG